MLNSILALIQGYEVADSVAYTGVAETTAQQLSVWDLCLKGGFIMIPLALMAIISIYVFVERFLAIKAAAKEDNTFMIKIKDYIVDGEIEAARNLCRRTDTPYARLIDKGISRIGRPTADVQVAIENVGNLEIARLEKGFPWLATTAAGAPMLGFLGTVTGMVQAFFALASAGGSANISILANGIYEALTTTVGGLIVGIIALFAYNYLVARINSVMTQLEAKTLEFMDLLNEPIK
ncbi:MAG: MotA/TolQ/ExbB proton channel family protein [Muribaculaceae bacterium]|nr:MotA/TolQ/ExbB proton channel family protein [Muribaculaceae bacterium]